MSTKPIDTAALRALAEAATPGERRIDLGLYEDPDGENDYAFARGPMLERQKFATKQAWVDQSRADARFAAALDRETVLALLAELDRRSDLVDMLEDRDAERERGR